MEEKSNNNKNSLKKATIKYCSDIENSLSQGELKGFKRYETSKKHDVITGVSVLEIKIIIKINDLESLRRLGYLK